MRTYLTNLYQNYPTRQNLGRQVMRRVFADGNVVVVNGYLDQTFVDRNGKLTPLMQRTSQTWVKSSGRWLLVDQHNSAMPAMP